MARRKPYYRHEMPERPLTQRLEIRISSEERIRLEQFCEERGLVVSDYVRGAVASCIKLTLQQEKWKRDRAAADDLARRLVGGSGSGDLAFVRTATEEARVKVG